jgi:hypothetical protein
MRDSDVRAAVRKHLDLQYADDADTRIVEEMGIWSGSVRIDIAVINGEMCGFELKSNRDTLERLPFQAELYSHVFDRVVLVTGERHVAKALPLIPDWWGVTVATERGKRIELILDRSPDCNPAPNPYLVAQLLWKEEALAVLDSFGLGKGWRAKRIKEIHQRLASELPFEQLSFQVREMLKRRNGWLR